MSFSKSLRTFTYENILDDNFAGCEITTGWSPLVCIIETDIINQKEGNGCHKITLTGVSGYAQRNILGLLDPTKNYFLSVELKNYDTTTGVKLRLNLVGDGGLLQSAYIVDTNYNRVGFVFQGSQFDGASSALLQILLSGVSGQYAFIDEFFLKVITGDEFAMGTNDMLNKYKFIRGIKQPSFSKQIAI